MYETKVLLVPAQRALVMKVKSDQKDEVIPFHPLDAVA